MRLMGITEVKEIIKLSKESINNYFYKGVWKFEAHKLKDTIQYFYCFENYYRFLNKKAQDYLLKEYSGNTFNLINKQQEPYLIGDKK